MTPGTNLINKSSHTMYLLVEDYGGFNFINMVGYYMVYSVPMSIEEVYESIKDLDLEIFYA